MRHEVQVIGSNRLYQTGTGSIASAGYCQQCPEALWSSSSEFLGQSKGSWTASLSHLQPSWWQGSESGSAGCQQQWSRQKTRGALRATILHSKSELHLPHPLCLFVCLSPVRASFFFHLYSKESTIHLMWSLNFFVIFLDWEKTMENSWLSRAPWTSPWQNIRFNYGSFHCENLSHFES